jgi:hypothetical protein
MRPGTGALILAAVLRESQSHGPRIYVSGSRL